MEQFLESTFLRFPHPPVKKLNIYRKRSKRLKTLIEETVKKLMNRCESILGFNPNRSADNRRFVKKIAKTWSNF